MAQGVAQTAETNSTPLILTVEDDAALAEELATAIEDYGMRAVPASEWDRALEQLESLRPDLIVLDQRLGRVDTLPGLPLIRARTAAPVLVLTGNRAEADRIVALEIGADDFLLKPISGRELVARIRAHLRRAMREAPPATPTPADTTTSGWRLSVQLRELRRPDGSVVPLTGAEFELLAALAERPSQPMDRDALTRRVLNRRWQPEDRALDNLVLNLRRKLGPEGERCIATVRGRGYAFTALPTN